MHLIVKIRLNQEWVSSLEKHPMIKKHLRGFLSSAIDAALIGRGKVVEIKFDHDTN